MSLDDKKPKTGRRRDNPMKQQRDFKSYTKFVAIAIVCVILVDFAVFRGERPYITQIKQDYYAKQAAREAALEEALPPVVVYPETGEPYFEAEVPAGVSLDEIVGEAIDDLIFDEDEDEDDNVTPKDLELKDEQSMLPEKELKIEPLMMEEYDLAEVKVVKPVKRAKKEFTGGKKKIALVIDDVGMNLKQSRAAIDLPAEVTLALLPYASKVKEMAKTAKADGHELIIHTPMEAINKDVPMGSLALYSDMDEAAFKAEFDKIFKSFDGYVGINNHMGSRLTQDDVAMKRIMKELKKRDLYFLDSRTIATSVAAEMAEAKGVPNATRDVFLDHEDTPEFLRKALKKTEKLASQYGYAIAIGHPKEVTMSALRQWIPTLEAKGYELVPLSELIDGAPKKDMKKVNKVKEAPKPKAKKMVAKTKTEASPKLVKPAQLEPSAGGDGFVDLVGELTPEDESIIIKPIDVQNRETGSFTIREPTNKIIMERGLPQISYPVE